MPAAPKKQINEASPKERLLIAVASTGRGEEGRGWQKGRDLSKADAWLEEALAGLLQKPCSLLCAVAVLDSSLCLEENPVPGEDISPPPAPHMRHHEQLEEWGREELGGMSSFGVLQLYPGFWLSTLAQLASAPMALGCLGPDQLLQLAAAQSRHHSSHLEGKCSFCKALRVCPLPAKLLQFSATSTLAEHWSPISRGLRSPMTTSFRRSAWGWSWPCSHRSLVTAFSGALLGQAMLLGPSCKSLVQLLSSTHGWGDTTLTGCGRAGEMGNASCHARHSMPKPYPLLPPDHRALTNPGQPGYMVGAGRRVP